MFFCEECNRANDWPGIRLSSWGTCEVCGRSDACYDVPSKYLAPRKDSVDNFNWGNDV